MNDTQIDDRTHAELLALQQIAAADIAFFKQQQWQVTNYGLLLYSAIVAAPKLLTEISTVEYSVLWIVALTVLLAGLYSLKDLEKSLVKGRDRLPEARKYFTQISLKAYAAGGDPKLALIPAKDRASMQWLLAFTFILGFILTTWFLVSYWSAGA